MTPDPKKVEALFDEALELAPVERAAFIERSCGDDEELLAAVRQLLRAHESADNTGFLPEINSTEGLARGEEEKPGAVLGRFTLLEQIGEGAFAVVWMAEQQEPVKRKVALKILKPGMDSKEIVGRFEVERQALAMMQHPNIATVFDAGTTDRCRPFFVMELVRGVPITEFCDANAMPAADRLRLFMKVCGAVEHAHRQGVVHRDIKPSNILVTLHDGVPVPKVIDFGIAKALEQDLTDRTLFTRFAQLIGTPVYMSPEQAEMSGLEIDARSDIYSLGVLLYELLTGSTPIEREELRRVAVGEMARLVREREPTRPSTRVTTLSEGERGVIAGRRGLTPRGLSQLLRGDLDWIVLKTLEKDRRRRYASASGLAEDLESYLSDRPVSARSPRWTYRLQKWLWRHRRGLRAAAPALALGALALYLYIQPAQLETGSPGLTGVIYDRKSVAVLPFVNRSDLKSDEYFTDGIHADLLAQISRLPGITTLSRDAVIPYRDTTKTLRRVGDELGIGTVVQGGVQRSGNSMRINVQLVDVQAGVNLWAETYTRKMTAENIFAVQSEIAGAIARALKTTLSSADAARLRKLPTDSLEALEAYFRGKSSDFSRTGQEEAVEWFQRAITIDPNFALAHAWLAHAYMNQVWYSALPVEVQAAKAEPLVQRALELDPELGKAYMVRGMITSWRRDFPAAVAAFERAIELDPSDSGAYTSYAIVLNWNIYDYEAALRLIDHALALQPGNEGLFLQKATILHNLGRYDDAIALLERIVEDQPHVNGAFVWLARCRIARDRNYVEAVKLGRQAHAQQPRDPWPAAFLFETYQTLQDEEQQRFWLQRMIAGYPEAGFVTVLNMQRHLLEGNLAEAEHLWSQEQPTGRLLGEPIDGEVFRRLLSSDLRSGRLDWARARYEKINPGWFHPDAEVPALAESNDYNNQINCLGLVMVLQRLGKTAQARHLLDGLVARIDGKAHDLLAYASFVRGDRDTATHHLSQIQEHPGARFDRLLSAGFWEPLLVLPEMQMLSDAVLRHMEAQREQIHQMEARHELPELPLLMPQE